MVGIGRQSLADPLFAKKILEGKNSEINYCIACGGCSVLLRHRLRPAARFILIIIRSC